MNQHVEIKPANEVVKETFPARLAYNDQINEYYGIPYVQWKYLTDVVYPSAKTPEAVILALEYCKARNLDILKKPVNIVPMWNSAKNAMVDTVWPGINEFRTTAHRTGEYAGCDEIEYGPEITRTFIGRVKQKGEWKDVEETVTFPEWAKITVFRITQGIRAPYTARVRWLETYAKQGNSDVPNTMWGKQRPYGQLDKCTEAAGLRMAFPEELGEDYTAEEMQGREIFDNSIAFAESAVSTTSLTPPPPPPAASGDSLPDAAESPSDTTSDGDMEDNGDFAGTVIERAEIEFDAVETAEALSTKWEDFSGLEEQLSEDDFATLQSLYTNRLNELASEVA